MVQEKVVDGWDDPRMPTVCGMRRRGYTPSAIREFCARVGVSKVESVSDPALLEWCVREDLNKTAHRRMAVIDPVKVVIDNWNTPHKNVVLPNNPLDESAGTREVPFGKEIWIDRADFMEEPEKKFFRMSPGREVRLRGACIFKCESVVKDDKGEVVEIHGVWDENSWGGNAADGRKVKGTIHWVDCATGKRAEFKLYDKLFLESDPMKEGSANFLKFLNPDSLKVVNGYVEPLLAQASKLERFQFERTGYFVCDGEGVFNRTCSLKDSYKP
jgi:glutaminyl-tRNA synthetase